MANDLNPNANPGRSCDDEVLDDNKALSFVAHLAETLAATGKEHPFELWNAETTIRDDTFCILPWTHAFINEVGWIYPCCHAKPITENGRPVTLYEKPLDEIRNSEFMVRLRRDLLLGKRSKICSSCWDWEERFGRSSSIRNWHTMNYLKYMGSSLEIEKIRAFANKGYTYEAPTHYQFMLSNVCNLACRMCYSGNSSRIEHDDVHGRWAPGSPALIWDDNVATIGPFPNTGVTLSGFSEHYLTSDDRFLSWTRGNASISFPIDPSTRIASIELKLGPDDAVRRLSVIFKGRDVWSGVTKGKGEVLSIPLDGAVFPDGAFQLGLLSWEVEAGPDGLLPRGIQIAVISIRRISDDRKIKRERVISRFKDKTRIWCDDDDLLFRELIPDAQHLRRLNVTGGEPLFNKKYFDILQHLIDGGAADKVQIALNSNCTEMPDRAIDLLSKFKSVEFNISLDAVDGDYEYMRYPAKWDQVRWNIEKARAHLPNAQFAAVPVMQIYNALRIHSLIAWCDNNDLCYQIIPLTTPPQLAVSLMPMSARILAAERIAAHAATIRENPARETSLNSCGNAIAYLRDVQSTLTPNLFRRFMQFTNDLDNSRGQRFAASYPELIASFEEEGYLWDMKAVRFTQPQ